MSDQVTEYATEAEDFKIKDGVFAPGQGVPPAHYFKKARGFEITGGYFGNIPPHQPAQNIVNMHRGQVTGLSPIDIAHSGLSNVGQGIGMCSSTNGMRSNWIPDEISPPQYQEVPGRDYQQPYPSPPLSDYQTQFSPMSLQHSVDESYSSPQSASSSQRHQYPQPMVDQASASYPSREYPRSVRSQTAYPIGHSASGNFSERVDSVINSYPSNSHGPRQSGTLVINPARSRTVPALDHHHNQQLLPPAHPQSPPPAFPSPNHHVESQSILLASPGTGSNGVSGSAIVSPQSINPQEYQQFLAWKRQTLPAPAGIMDSTQLPSTDQYQLRNGIRSASVDTLQTSDESDSDNHNHLSSPPAQNTAPTSNPPFEPYDAPPADTPSPFRYENPGPLSPHMTTSGSHGSTASQAVALEVPPSSIPTAVPAASVDKPKKRRFWSRKLFKSTEK